MADVKISAAADAGTLVATDKVPLARSASTTAYSATMAEISTWANTQLPTASTSVAGVVKVDGTSITIASGVISGAAAVPPATGLPAMDGTPNAGVVTAYSRGDHIHPSDTSRAPLASPTFTGAPAAPTPTTGDNSTKIATTAFVQAQMVASGAGVSTWNTRAGAVVLQQSDITAVGALNDTGRNLIHNGTFAVAQRGTGPWTTAGVYIVDRWKIAPGANGDTFSFTVVALSDADRAAIGDEAAGQCLQNTFTGNAGAAAFHNIQTPLEFVRQLAGKTVTVSLWAKAASGTPKLGFGMDQSFGSGGSPSVAVSLNGIAVTLSTTWTRYSVTFAMPGVAGKTMGTNGDNATIPSIWFSSGTNQATRSGNIGVQSGTIQLWGIQLEIGSTATPLAKREYAEELRLCQRYFQTSGYNLWGYGGASGTFGATFVFPVTMRGTPTISLGSPTLSNLPSLNSAADLRFVSIYGTPTATGNTAFSGSFTASSDL